MKKIKMKIKNLIAKIITAVKIYSNKLISIQNEINEFHKEFEKEYLKEKK